MKSYLAIIDVEHHISTNYTIDHYACTDLNWGSLMMHNYFYRKDLIRNALKSLSTVLLLRLHGYKERVCRGQLDDHMTSNIQLDLVILVGTYKEVKRRLEDLESASKPKPKKAKMSRF